MKRLVIMRSEENNYDRVTIRPDEILLKVRDVGRCSTGRLQFLQGCCREIDDFVVEWWKKKDCNLVFRGIFKEALAGNYYITLYSNEQKHKLKINLGHIE